MRTVHDIERYLGLTGHPYDSAGEGTWIVRLEPQGVPLVVRYESPVLEFRINIMKLPATNREPLLLKLLDLNVGDMVHGAFGLEGEDIVLSCTLQVENLDQNELEAVVDSFEMTVSDLVPTLPGMSK
jgi:hypothetical protein